MDNGIDMLVPAMPFSSYITFSCVVPQSTTRGSRWVVSYDENRTEVSRLAMAMKANMMSTTPPTTFLLDSSDASDDATIDFIHCRIKKCWLQQRNNVGVRKGGKKLLAGRRVKVRHVLLRRIRE